MPTFASIGAAVAKVIRNPIVREVIAAALAATARYVIRRMKRRPTAP
jgi:uncharacterized membrane protein YfcA